MSASRNKNSTGLRIVWIPGRKKQHHKGRFDSTNKHVDYSKMQKRSQPWSLGGSKAQEQFFKTEVPGTSDGHNVISNILPASCIVATGAGAGAGATTSTTTDPSHNIMKLDEEPNKFAILGTLDEKETNNGNSIKPIEEKSTPEPIEKTLNGNNCNNTSTLLINNKKGNHLQSMKQEDLNSIEHLADNDSIDNRSNIDLTDSSFHNNLNRDNSGKKNKSKKKKKKNKKANKENGNDVKDEEEEEEEKVVKCLYYTLMCCECTIS